jgi:hypothetical protein
VRLVVNELATNAVVHAAGLFTVSHERQNGSLTLRVTDAFLQPLRGPSSRRPRAQAVAVFTSWLVSAPAGASTASVTVRRYGRPSTCGMDRIARRVGVHPPPGCATARRSRNGHLGECRHHPAAAGFPLVAWRHRL